VRISVGQFSDRGKKERNQDFYGVQMASGRQLQNKGVAAVIADGVSTSERGQEAACACVAGFLADYFSTPESWSVQKSVKQLLTALNAWLYAQGHSYREASRGLLSTLSALILKSTTAHVFHAGDSRIYRLRAGRIEPLMVDHKTWLAADRCYLSRALGADTTLEIDYRRLPLEVSDVFVFTTDGVHEFVADRDVARIVGSQPVNLDKAAEIICQAALANGSNDNVTCQILRIDELPAQQADEVYQQLTELPFPPALEPGMVLEGYRIVRELQSSRRTQLYLAEDLMSGLKVALKTPSVSFEDEPAYIEQFIQEEWVGRRLENPHVMKILAPRQPRRFLYSVAEYIDGRTLRQWLNDHSRSDLETARRIIEQIGKGLQAFHRLEMTHRDLKPENILIDANGTVKIIDFGSTRVAGIAEIAAPFARSNVLGTRNYLAPEHLLGEPGDQRSDLYALGVIAYEMLSGALPYGGVPERWQEGQRLPTLCYAPAANHRRDIPMWIDGALRKAVHPDPAQRYAELSEFLFDLRHPNRALSRPGSPPLLERHPVFFWKMIAGLLLLANLILLYLLIL